MAREQGDAEGPGEATGQRTAPDVKEPAPAPGPAGQTTKPGPGTEAAKPVAADPGRPPLPGGGDVHERLDGMRGWLGDLDHTVGVRSRIGLVLAAIAIGAAGAAIYLSLNAKEESASDREVRELRDDLNGVQEDVDGNSDDLRALRSSVKAARSQASGANATASKLQRRVRTLRADVRDLQQSASSAAATPQAGALPDAGTTTTPDTGTTTTPDTGGAGTGSGGGGGNTP